MKDTLVTLDTGKTWSGTRFLVMERISVPMEASVYDFRLCDDSTIYLRSEVSVFRSTDKGASWQTIPALEMTVTPSQLMYLKRRAAGLLMSSGTHYCRYDVDLEHES
ncbi:MAG: hypothetical protein IH600_08920 [Bacteroidetes bacterium]|nr:hypothetical protein [Bacteroidota bacterium]